MSLQRAEHIRDEYLSDRFPDSAIARRVCEDEDCGACVPEDECEKIGGRFYCDNCIARNPHFYAALRHYEAVIARNDGGGDR
jgi:hypothetical protein